MYKLWTTDRSVLTPRYANTTYRREDNGDNTKDQKSWATEETTQILEEFPLELSNR